MTERNDTPQTRAGRRWVGWALGISLALNLAVIGVVAGAAWRIGGPEGPGFRPPPLAGAIYTRALEPGDRRALMGQMRRALGAERHGRDEIRGQYAAMIAALTAEPFDPEVVEALIAAQRETAVARLSAGQQVLASHIRQMSAEDRARFAKRLSEVLARGLRERRGGKLLGGRMHGDGMYGDGMHGDGMH